MAESIQRSRGRPSGYKLDRGNVPNEGGPFIGEVMNNVDPTKNGRVQVYIEELAKPDKNDSSGWRTVSYLTPFYGSTLHSGVTTGDGTYPGNSNSYGMWFTAPDLGIRVMCFFVNGDPNFGYYVGCVPESGINHKNNAINEDPRFFDQNKPVHSYVAGTMLQQGLDKDTVRGPINSSAQRESPSNAYGITTPGRPVYAGGYSDATVKQTLEANTVTKADAKIIGRRGGHSFVMDDGDLEGNNQLVRIRTSKGHQITMSDDGDSFYITHANGQSWIELGKEGTVDVYSSNSVNVRTEGSINLHADDDINLQAGRAVNIKGNSSVTLESPAQIGIKSDGTIALVSSGQTTVNSGGNFAVVAPRIDWQDAPTLSVSAIPTTIYDDVKYKNEWIPDTGKITSISTRVPTHEPYNAHNSSITATATSINRTTMDADIVALINNLKVNPPKY